jgi:hypothetical protein
VGPSGSSEKRVFLISWVAPAVVFCFGLLLSMVKLPKLLFMAFGFFSMMVF